MAPREVELVDLLCGRSLYLNQAMCVVQLGVLTQEASSAEINGNLSLCLGYMVSFFSAQPKGERKRVLVRAKFFQSKCSEGISEFSWRRTERSISHLTCLILFPPQNRLRLHLQIGNGEGIQFHIFYLVSLTEFLFVM